MVKQTAYAKFDEAVELAVRLGVDPKRADQMVRGTTILPHGTGKKVRIVVFAKGEKEKEAREAGADFVGADDLLEKIKGGWLDFDHAVATPDMMASVGKLGKVLGPRGLMPNPKTGTVTFEVKKAIEEIRKGRVEYKVDKAGIVHVLIGKVSFTVAQITEKRSCRLDVGVESQALHEQGEVYEGGDDVEHHGAWRSPGVRDPCQTGGFAVVSRDVKRSRE